MNIFDDKTQYYNRMLLLSIYLNIIRGIIFIAIAWLFFVYSSPLFNMANGESISNKVWVQFGLVGLLLILNIVSYKRPTMAFAILTGLTFIATLAIAAAAIMFINYTTEDGSGGISLYGVLAISCTCCIITLSGLIIARKSTRLAEKISAID